MPVPMQADANRIDKIIRRLRFEVDEIPLSHLDVQCRDDRSMPTDLNFKTADLHGAETQPRQGWYTIHKRQVRVHGHATLAFALV